MSTLQGVDFGKKYGTEYAEVLTKWALRLKGVRQITDEMRKEWASDLNKALGKTLTKTLINQSDGWKTVGPLPDQETIKRFAQTATKSSLTNDTNDLLERLRLMAQEPEPVRDSLTAANTVSEALKRVNQTVSQVFDMVKDRFNGLMERFNRRKGNLTGRRRWRTVSGNQSRHRSLEGETRKAGENFNYQGRSIYGPRPPGGDPAAWSNCACYLQFERPNGEWVTVS